MSSRHAKRISVFDRLGPGNDGEPSTSSVSQTHHLPSRGHRHYSVDKSRNVPDERLRERKLSGSSRRHGSLTPVGAEASKRERTSSVPSRSLRHSELDTGNEEEEKRRSSSRHSRKPKGKDASMRGGDAEEERRDVADRLRDDDGRRRKRDRFSVGDSEAVYPDSKRSRDEPVGERRHHEPPRTPSGRDADDKGQSSDVFSHRQQPTGRHRRGQERTASSDVPMETDPDYQAQSLDAVQSPDWAALTSMKVPSSLLPGSASAKRFSAGSVLVRVGLSSQLAGFELAERAKEAAMGHVQDVLGLPHDDVQQLIWGDTVCQLALSHFSHFREQASLKGLMCSVQPCRKALTACADFALRKKLLASKKGPISSVTPESSLDSEFYQASLCLYHDSPASNKNRRFPVRMENSLVGSVLVHR